MCACHMYIVGQFLGKQAMFACLFYIFYKILKGGSFVRFWVYNTLSLEDDDEEVGKKQQFGV